MFVLFCWSLGPGQEPLGQGHFLHIFQTNLGQARAYTRLLAIENSPTQPSVTFQLLKYH